MTLAKGHSSKTKFQVSDIRIMSLCFFFFFFFFFCDSDQSDSDQNGRILCLFSKNIIWVET